VQDLDDGGAGAGGGSVDWLSQAGVGVVNV